MTRQQVEHVVEEADPRRARPRAGAVQRQRQLDLVSRPSCARSSPCGSSRWILPHARLHRARVPLEALRPRDRGTRGRQPARPSPHPPRRGAPPPSAGGSAAARDPTRSAPRPPSAGCGWSPPRSPRTPSPPPRRRTRSPPPARARPAPPARRRSAAGAPARTRSRSPAPRARRRSAPARTPPGAAPGARPPGAPARRRPGPARPPTARSPRPGCPTRARPGPAGRAPPGAGPRPRRTAPPGRSGPRTRRSRRGRTSWRLASCTYRLPGPTITSTARTVCVPYVSAATACAPPIRYTRSTPSSRHVPSTVRVDLAVPARRGADRDVQHARRARRHDTHHRRARIGRPPPRHVHRRRFDRQLAQRHALTLRQVDRDVRLDRRLRHLRDVRDRDLQARDDLQRHPLQRGVQLLRRRPATAAAPRPPCRTRGSGRAPPRRPLPRRWR